MVKQYLITGTGRCGTGYMAQLFSSVGIGCTHEGIFKPLPKEVCISQWNIRLNNPQWQWQAESSWLAAPVLEHLDLSNVTVIHIVRHPKLVIDSHIRIHDKNSTYSRWLHLRFPQLDGLTIENEFSTKYILLNRIIEPYADYFHRVEDNPCALLDELGFEYDSNKMYANTRYNSRDGVRESDVELEDFDNRERLLKISEEYGYSW